MGQVYLPKNLVTVQNRDIQASTLTQGLIKVSTLAYTRLDDTLPTLLFSHIPKCAGTSVLKHVSSQYQRAEIRHVYNAELHLNRPNSSFIERFKARRDEVRMVYGHFFFGVHHLLDTPPCYLTVLREPVSRVASLYQQFARNRMHQGLSLKEFVESQITPRQTNNQMTRMIAGGNALVPERLADRAFLDQAKSNIHRYFLFTGVMSSLNSDLLDLGRFLGWRRGRFRGWRASLFGGLGVRGLPKLNASGNRPSNVDDETKRTIAKLNALDIELYDWIVKSKRRLRPENMHR